MKQPTRGGLRSPSGGRPKKPDKRITVQLCLSPDNAEYLAEMGKEKNNYLNNLLEKERGKTKNMATYISFIGFLETPSEQSISILNRVYPPVISEVLEGYNSHDEPVYKDYNEGFRNGLEYKEIGGKDSLTIYLANLSAAPGIGHLVADCTPGGWVSDTFVMLDENGDPIKAAENFNPNPVEQLL